MTRFALLVLVACGGSQSPSSTPASTPQPSCSDPAIELSFAWPEDLMARVYSVERTASQNSDGSRPMEGASEADYALRIERDASATRVRFEAGDRERLRSNGLIPTIGEARTVVHLDARGKVTRVDGAASMRDQLAAMVQRQQLTQEQADGIVRPLGDAEQLVNASAAWGNLVSTWHQRRFQCGETQTARITTSAFFAAPMQEVDMDVSLQYVGAVDCPSTREEGVRCVHLRLEGETEPQSLRAARARHYQGGTEPRQARVRRAVDLIVEPEGLIPHEVTIEELSELGWRGDMGIGREIYDASQYRFRYGPQTTRILMSTDGAGFAVIDESGRPAQRPDTPECRALTACCSAAGTAEHPGAINLMCAISMTPAQSEGEENPLPPCVAELTAVHGALVAQGATIPEGCSVP